MLSAHYQLQEGRGVSLALPPSAAAPGSAADAEDGDSTSGPATAVAATEGDGGSGLGSAALLSRSAALSQAALLPEDAPVRKKLRRPLYNAALALLALKCSLRLPILACSYDSNWLNP
jgi:hypothetical protein